MSSIRIRRHNVTFQPESGRVIIRPFIPGKPQIMANILTRALALKVDDPTWRRLGYMAAPALSPLNGFAYLLSLGFKRPSLLPRFLAAPLIAVDRLFPAGLTAMRIDLRARKAA